MSRLARESIRYCTREAWPWKALACNAALPSYFWSIICFKEWKLFHLATTKLRISVLVLHTFGNWDKSSLTRIRFPLAQFFIRLSMRSTTVVVVVSFKLRRWLTRSFRIFSTHGKKLIFFYVFFSSYSSFFIQHKYKSNLCNRKWHDETSRDESRPPLRSNSTILALYWTRDFSCLL